MVQTFRRFSIFQTTALLLVAASGTLSLQAQTTLPEGRGRNEFQRICGQCHGVEMAIKLRMSEDRWAGVVDDMVSRGAQGTQDDFDRVSRYLGKYFGPDSAAAGKVSVNKASAKDLAAAGIPEDEAALIVSFREKNGALKSWAELEKIPGLDLKKLEAKKDQLDFTAH